MKKVAIYARSGSETALARQLGLLEAHAGAQAWTASAVYTDLGKGSVRERKGLSQLIADVQAGLVDVILVTELSRLFRGREFAPALYDDLMTGKIGLATPDGFLNEKGSMPLLGLAISFHMLEMSRHDRRTAFARTFDGATHN
jgi:DNA invertase Pin-like site-specific DNA recombinase